jgi:hypothetical protein
LSEIALRSKYNDAALAAIELIEDGEILRCLAVEWHLYKHINREEMLRRSEAAVDRIGNQQMLMEIALDAASEEIAVRAVKRISSNSVLEKIFVKRPLLGDQIIKQVDDLVVMKRIAEISREQGAHGFSTIIEKRISRLKSRRESSVRALAKEKRWKDIRSIVTRQTGELERDILLALSILPDSEIDIRVVESMARFDYQRDQKALKDVLNALESAGWKVSLDSQRIKCPVCKGKRLLWMEGLGGREGPFDCAECGKSGYVTVTKVACTSKEKTAKPQIVSFNDIRGTLKL